MGEGILKGKKWANREISKVKVIPGLAERAELSATGAAVGRSKQALTASVIGIVSAVGRSVDIKPVTEIGEIEAAAAGVHVNITGRLKIGSGVSIASKAWRQYLPRKPRIAADRNGSVQLIEDSDQGAFRRLTRTG
jgi:hypothetical protein